MRTEERRGGQHNSNPRRVAYLTVGACLCMLLTACASGSADGGAQTPTLTAGTSSTSVASTTPSGPIATPFINGTPGTDLGAADSCTQTSTPSASLPSTIPAYPGADLRVGQVNGANGVFGLCTSDSVDAVDTFYAGQLPSHGWQQVTNETLQTSRQLTGKNGDASLVLTISPDGSVVGKSQILIIYSGGS